MRAAHVVEVARTGWLTLAFMILLSRAAFQASGPARMRAFLDRWQSGPVRRVWGALSLAVAAVLAAVALPVLPDLRALDLVVLGSLLLVLVADGFLNVLPTGFETFKSRLQERWVSARRGTGRGGDRHLFAAGNALLALAASGVVAFVLAYRPIAWLSVLVAACVAMLLTLGLISAASRHPTRRP